MYEFTFYVILSYSRKRRNQKFSLGKIYIGTFNSQVYTYVYSTGKYYCVVLFFFFIVIYNIQVLYMVVFTTKLFSITYFFPRVFF